MQNAEYLVAELKMEARDGCFHFYSEELPGFHLCTDRLVEGDIDQDISSAIEYFFRHARGVVVRVSKAASPLQLLQRAAAQPPKPTQKRFVMTPEFAVA